jgi:2'-hydroxyisoflavone reductase
MAPSGMTRRTFLAATGSVAVACATRKVTVSAPPPKLKLLILGGTNFIGPHIVDALLARGHTVTLFNRGKTHAELFPQLEKLRGDRDGDLKALVGRKWDAVIDPSGFVPRIVRASAELLAPNIGHYVFISSISVYPEGATKVGMNEDDAVAELPAGAEASEEVPKYYGALKAACEKTVAQVLPGRSSSVRPGLIVGPRDPTDRFTYWPVRVARGGEVLAPGNGDDPVQFIDARDLARFLVTVVEQRATGTFNATGPAARLSIRELLQACKRAAGSDARFVWVDAKFLEEQKVSPWSDLPVWAGSDPTNAFAQIDCRRAIGRGLTFRSAEETARDTLAWWATLPEERRAKLRTGLSADRETAVLSAWSKRKA